MIGKHFRKIVRQLLLMFKSVGILADLLTAILRAMLLTGVEAL